MNKKPFVLHIDPTQIIVPPGVQRPVADKVSDHVLRRSIEQTGIQQPLVVLADGETFRLIDGVRRLEIAKALGIPKVPAAVDHLPPGEPSADAYALRMRRRDAARVGAVRGGILLRRKVSMKKRLTAEKGTGTVRTFAGSVARPSHDLLW